MTSDPIPARPSLSLAAARRIALAAQGIGRPARLDSARLDPTQRLTLAGLTRQIGRLGLIQIDTVNVLARAHLMPLFTRLGAYDTAVLDRAAGRPPRRLFEYWGHEAALIDVRLYQAWRWKMADAATYAWHRMDQVRREQPHLVDQVLAAVAEAGPVTARQLGTGRPRARGQWGWNWSEAKSTLEWLFMAGQVACAGRNNQFERLYDLPERVIPAAIWAEPPLDRATAHQVLVRQAARALGVATTADIADYFRLNLAETRAALDHLAAAGEVIPVTVEGWRQPAWQPADSPRPRRLAASCLVSPFDSLIFHRRRLADLFGVDYRIEIYTPAAQRRWGYYVYLYLLGETFAARVDLKADRAAGRLLVQSAWREPSALQPDRVIAAGLAAELARLAAWLGLAGIVVAARGDLAAELGRAVVG